MRLARAGPPTLSPPQTPPSAQRLPAADQHPQHTMPVTVTRPKPEGLQGPHVGRKRKICCAGPAAPSGSRAAGEGAAAAPSSLGSAFPAPREDVSPRVRAGGAGQQEILVCVFLFLGFRPQSRTGSGSRGDRTRPVIVAWALPWGPLRAKASVKTGQVMVVPAGKGLALCWLSKWGRPTGALASGGGSQKLPSHRVWCGLVAPATSGLPIVAQGRHGAVLEWQPPAGTLSRPAPRL